MAKKKKRRSRSFTIPVAMVAGLAPLGNSVVTGIRNDGLTGMAKETTFALTGYDYYAHNWQPSFMWNGTYPILLGWGIHKVAQVLGINRALGAAGIPFIRI